MADNFDVIIIGGGAAGCSAALTCLNRGKTVGIVTNPTETSSLYKAEMVTNYPGLPAMTGKEMTEAFRKQIDDSDAQVIEGRALSAMSMGDIIGVAVGPEFYMAKALIIAAGITRENLYLGEAEFLGRGVSYCATCDGMLYRGKTVALIGSSREARHDVEFLKGIGCNVLHFSKPAKCSITGESKVSRLSYGNEEYDVDCVFIIKDTVSVLNLVPGLECSNGSIVTDKMMRTNIPGIYAAGDCAGKPYQLAKAAGEGNIAALSACEYIDRK